MSYYCAKELPLLLRDIEKFSSQMLEYGQKTIFLQILPIWQCVLNLSGLSNDPCDMDSGEAMNKQHLVGNENVVGEQARWSYLMQISFYVGDFDLASKMSAKLRSLNIGFMKAHVLYQVRVFFFGLIAIENARHTGKRKYFKEAAKHISVMRSWVEKKAVNLEHKLSILEAEYESLTVKNGQLLRSKYDDAIQMSIKAKFMQDAALATQLASRAMLRSDDGMTYAEATSLARMICGCLGVRWLWLDVLKKIRDFTSRVYLLTYRYSNLIKAANSAISWEMEEKWRNWRCQ
ncbi:PFAM Protein kinase domain [Fragilaria crotonensis]|nr:PFAM Protein kinase domain [Fragilaria crotonensis]